jgi:hypothetical protein
MSNVFRVNKNIISFLAILAFIASVFLFMLINRMNSWKILERTYGYSKPFIGKCWENQYVVPDMVKQDGFISGKGSSITLCKNSDGISLSYPNFFIIGGGSPIVVPWSEITYEVKKEGQRVDIHFSKTPEIWLQIDKSLWDKVVNYKNS